MKMGHRPGRWAQLLSDVDKSRSHHAAEIGKVIATTLVRACQMSFRNSGFFKSCDMAGMDSGSSSDCSEQQRAARDRVSQSTQADYNSHMRGLKRFAVDNRSLFLDCFSDGQLIEPVRYAIGKAYLCHLRDSLLPWPLDPRPADTRTGLKHYSTSKINGVIGAIKYSYSKLSCPLPYAENKFYDDFRHSFKNIIARAKAVNAYPATSGTVPLSTAATMRLLEAAIKYVPTGNGAAESSVRQLWLFLLFSIATCGRGERVSRIQLQFISWFADSLTAQIPTSKSDTEGLMSYAKMCAANPWNPLCCLVTALGVEFVSRDASSSFEFLFGGAGAASDYTVTRLQTALKCILNIVGEENLGAAFHRLTGHFLKKTGVSFLRSTHECVSHDSRELRADHKVGPYNLRSDQDAIAGRILAFLKPGSEEFSVAPPHFHPRITAAIPWADIVPGYNLYSSSTKMAVHACVASVVHNSQFLDKHMSSSHPYHGCRLRKTQGRWVSLLQPYVLGGRSGFKSIMDATGQSLISSIAVDLRLIRQRGISGCGAGFDEAVAEIADLKRTVVRLTQVIEGCPAFSVAAGSNSSVSRPAFAIGYLPESFRFPVGISTEDCWYRWHDARNPLREINSKMLPASLSPVERGRQLCLRRKIKGVMGILQGQTPNTTVDLDPQFVWQACWARCVNIFGIHEPCTWAVGTVYDFLLKQPDHVKDARIAPAIAYEEAAAAAATSSAKAAQDAATFALASAANPPVRAVNGNPPVLAPVDDAVAVAAAEAVAAGGSRAADEMAFSLALDAHVDAIIEDDELAGVENNELAGVDGNSPDVDVLPTENASPYPVSVDSVVANILLQANHAPNRTEPEPPELNVEYGPISGVRCLVCMRFIANKSNYNRHLLTNPACEQQHSFRHVHKRIRHDEVAAAASAAAFTEADQRHNEAAASE